MNYHLSLLLAFFLLGLLAISRSDASTDSLAPTFEGRVPKNAVRQFFPGGQYILLTFSGGPHKEVTPEILHILQNHSVHASFFVTGQRVLHQPQLLSQLVHSGHDVGHSGFYSMIQLSRKSKDEIGAQISSTVGLLKNVTHKEAVSFFRPPGYFISDELANWISENAATTKTILWSIDLNYLLKEQQKSIEQVVELLRTRAKPGDIIHCQESRATVRALPTIIDTLRAMRYEFLTLTQVLSFPDDSPH